MQTLRISFNGLQHTHTREFLVYTRERAERLNIIARELADMFGVRVQFESQAFILAEQCPLQVESQP